MVIFLDHAHFGLFSTFKDLAQFARMVCGKRFRTYWRDSLGLFVVAATSP